MQIKPPRNTEKYFWTQHAIYKLRQYGLSAQRVIRVINNPQRKEEGIVEKAVAVMQPTSVSTKNGKRVWNSEIWAMYTSARGGKVQSSKFQPKADPPGAEKVQSEIKNSKFQFLNSANRQIRIISAWRYPGVSPQNNPIPEEILREISELSD